MRSNRRKYPQDALRWLMGVFLAAVVASAGTSAVFLTARREPTPPDALQEKLRVSKEIVDSLKEDLETVARATIEQDRGAKPPAVAVVYRTDEVTSDDPAEGDMPLVAPDDKALMRGASTPWTLQVSTTDRDIQFARIVDIRDSTSLSSPGYIGIVEVQVTTTQRELARTGNLPFQPPEGFQLVSSAEYTELEQSPEYNVRPVSSVVDERTYQFAHWTPATAPPAELPEAIQRQFNEAIAQCATAAPTNSSDRQRLTFFYSLRERKWIPRP